MKLHKAFKHAIDMVVHSRLRSWLTILGIVIGVAAVVSIVALGQGLQQEVSTQLGQLGTPTITVSPGASRAFVFQGPGGTEAVARFSRSSSASSTNQQPLTDQDVRVIRGVTGVKSIDTLISGSVHVIYASENGTARMTGVDPAAWNAIDKPSLAQGRTLSVSDSNAIVIGGGLASGFFKRPLGLNQVVSIEGKSFRVVGILNDSSTSIYAPIKAASAVIPDATAGQYDQIVVSAVDSANLTAIANSITAALTNSRHKTASTRDFSVDTSTAFQSNRASITSSLTSFLTAIALVALLVGAVGIANTMFTSVLERTKQIGIMKAIGARNADILRIFLLYAGLIGLIGGVLGIMLGSVLSGVLPSLFGSQAGVLSIFSRSSATLSLKSIALALGLSVFIGVASGLVPAIQASRLRPVDALRQE